MPPQMAELLGQCFAIEPAERPIDLRTVTEVLRETYAAHVGHEYPRRESTGVSLAANTLNNRALSLIDLDRGEEAEKAWHEALVADPHHFESVYNHGLLDWRAGRIHDVKLRRQLREAGTSGERWHVARYLARKVELERDDCEEAMSILERLDASELVRPEVQSALSYAREHLTKSRRLARTFKGFTEEVGSAFLSADGRYALSGGRSKLEAPISTLKALGYLPERMSAYISGTHTLRRSLGMGESGLPEHGRTLRSLGK